jgi:hypothetical protein
MSKLKELFEGSQYARLNTLPGGRKNFSVRKQSDTRQEVRQGNAVDFFDNRYQDGFDVDKPSLSVTGFRKAPESQNSDFTGSPTGQATLENNAFDSYNRFANDAFRNTYNSKLVHRFLATDSTRQYKTQQQTSAGIVLTYNV